MRLILLFLLFPVILFAQDDYEKWLKSQQEKLTQYIDKEDKAFADFLRKSWITLDVTKGTEPLDKPKPQTVPSVITNKEKQITVSPVESKPKTINEEKIPPEPVTSKGKTFAFYGAETEQVLTEGGKYPVLEKLDNKGIADFWEKVSATEYKAASERALLEKKRLKLNDWGYAKLIYENSRLVYAGRKNESYLLTWFMLIKSGYDIRVGYENNEVFLLIPVSGMLFSVPFITISENGGKYFMIRFEEGKVQGKAINTYKEEKNERGRLFDFSINELPETGGGVEEREFKYRYAGKEHLLKIRYRKGLIEYFRLHPQTELGIYFGTEMSSEGRESLVKELKEIVKDMNERDKVSYLLTFVQFFTQYKTDREQFGREKPLFIEETLFYPYSDCEDRSVLFAYLVKIIVGLDVIGLEYPNHIATAVGFTVDVEGDKVTYGNKKYLICDPTYMGADIGKGMDQFVNVVPKIIEEK